jgi:hypothetical protein
MSDDSLQRHVLALEFTRRARTVERVTAFAAQITGIAS